MSDSDSVDSRLGRIEGKVDVLLDIHKEARDDHETRLRDLETSKMKMHGVTTVIGLVTSFFFNLFSSGHR